MQSNSSNGNSSNGNSSNGNSSNGNSSNGNSSNNNSSNGVVAGIGLILIALFMIPSLFKANDERVKELTCELVSIEGETENIVNYDCSTRNLQASEGISYNNKVNVIVTGVYEDNKYQVREGFRTWIYSTNQELHIGQELVLDLPVNKESVRLDLSQDFTYGESGDIHDLQLSVDEYGELIVEDGFNSSRDDVHPQGLFREGGSEAERVDFCVLNSQMIVVVDRPLQLMANMPDNGETIRYYGSRLLVGKELGLAIEAVERKDQLVRIEALKVEEGYSLINSNEVYDFDECIGSEDPERRVAAATTIKDKVELEVLSKDIDIRYKEDPISLQRWAWGIFSIIMTIAIGYFVVSAFYQMIEDN